MNTYSTFYLFTIWLICLLTFIISTSCTSSNEACFYVHRQENTKETNLAEFNHLTLDLPGTYTIKQGEKHHISVKGNAYYLDSIRTSVGNKNLHVFQKGAYCDDHLSYSMTITLPKLQELNVRKNANINILDFEDQSELKLDISKKSVVDINRFKGLQKFYAQLSQGGAIFNHQMIDTLNEMNIKIEGNGAFKGYPVPSKKVAIQINGNGYCEVNTTERLNVVILGNGTVNSLGMPSLYKRITGKGSVNFNN